MTITATELKEYLTDKVPEIDLLELLKLTSEDLVLAFEDYIDANADKFIRELELEGKTINNEDETEWWEYNDE